MRGEAGEPDQAESLDDACMNDLSVLTLLSYPAAAVGKERKTSNSWGEDGCEERGGTS